jgi:hypothetical protein
MAPKKAKEAEVKEPQEQLIEDPAAQAAREQRERLLAEERRVFERNEIIARRRIDAMEQVGWKCLLLEREKRTDPNGYASKVSRKAPPSVVVKLLTGNRAVPQRIFHIPVADATTVTDLKLAIQKQAVELGLHPQLYEADRQKLFVFGKDVAVDETNTTIKSLGIGDGAMVHLALVAPLVDEIYPSMI